jgi:uncharacterized protein (DUF3084 family)
MPENTVKPGFEIEPIEAICAAARERDNLKEEVKRLQRLLDTATDNSSYRNTIDRLRAENERLKEVARQYADLFDHREALRAERDKLGVALAKIKFRNHPGTTDHELAKEALSRTSEET